MGPGAPPVGPGAPAGLPPAGPVPPIPPAGAPGIPPAVPGVPPAPPGGAPPAPGTVPGLGAGANPMAQLLLEVMQTLRSKVPLPVFYGKQGEDPITFRKKALDYMEDANIPQAEQMNAFKLCLDRKARQWYDEITVPPQWNDLMTLFCGCFCIYRRTCEEWYDAWQRLNYD